MRSLLFICLFSFVGFSQHSIQSTYPNIAYGLPQGLSKKTNPINSNVPNNEIKGFNPIQESYNMESQSFQNAMMVQSESDVTYRLDNYTSINFDENDLTDKTSIQYDDNGNRTLQITYSWDSEAETYVPRLKNEYFYDDNGYQSLTIQYNWDSESESFAPRSKNEYTNDENGRQTLQIFYSWNLESQSLTPQSKYEYTYDVNGNLTQYVPYFWDSVSQSFSPRYKDEYTYDENGYRIVETNLIWNSASQSYFINSKNEYTYDSNGRINNQTVYQSRTISIVGTWKLAPEVGALGVGPAKDDISWWSNTTNDVATRSCLFDDEYVFNEDGSFQNVLGTDTWLEYWQGVTSAGCGTPVAPHDGTANASYTFDVKTGNITINGIGAYLGLPKIYNGGELTDPTDAKNEITYLAEVSPDGRTLDLDIEIENGAYWSFKLVRDVVPAEQQDLMPNFKYEYYYDSTGRQFYTQYDWNSTLEIFIPNYKQFSEYDEQGRSVLTNGYSFDICMDQRTHSEKRAYIYDDVLNGRTFRYFSKDSNGDFVFGYDIGYFYDDNGRILKRNQFVNLDIYWSGYYWSYENTYDDNGNIVQRINSKWDTDTESLVLYKRELKTYDDTFYPSNLIQRQIDKFYPSIGVYKPSFKKDYSIYSETDTQLVIVGITQQYDTNFNTWTTLDGEEYKSYWYYTKESALSANALEPMAFTIYPNPTSNSLQINSLESLKNPLFEMFDVRGRKVLSSPFKLTESIDVSNLQPSMYIYNVKDGNEVKQHGKVLVK